MPYSLAEQNEKSLSLKGTFFSSLYWSVLFQLAAKGHRQPFWISGLGSNLRGILGLWDILRIDLLCFNVFFLLHRNFRFWCKTPDDDFKAETEISTYVLRKDIEKNVKTQEVKPIHKMFQRP